jgi:hypothetical protein
MAKKLLMGHGPMLVVAALAVMPAVARAAPGFKASELITVH